MAIIMILVTTGVVPFNLAAAMILGENIGTTIAANIAASVGNTAAKRTAISHTIINMFGVCWVLCIFPYWLKLIGHVVTLFGLPDPNTADLTDAANADAIATSLLYSVCTMHTLFNMINILILVWFIPLIAKLCCLIFPDRSEDESFRLKYIAAGPLSTAELSISEAEQELINFGEVCYKDFGYIRQAIAATDEETFEKLREKLVHYEEITDRMEYEVAAYLAEVSNGEISATSASRIKGIYRIIGEMESLGDSGESISRILGRMRAHDKAFEPEMLENLQAMLDCVDGGFQAMLANLSVPSHMLRDISNADQAEGAINDCRNRLREEHINNIENAEYNYQTGVYYIDIVYELEKMGDYMINVSQAIMKENEPVAAMS